MKWHAAASLVGLTLAVGACARAEATRTSANTMIIDASAAPVCGGVGASRVAAKSAAIETIKAGYDGYIITGAASQNNVTTTTLPGTVNTYGTVSSGAFNATSTYTPGPTIVAGSRDRQLGVVMFRKGEQGFVNSIDARQTLGNEWENIVKSGVVNCVG